VTRGGVCAVCFAAVAVAASGCAKPRLQLPTGPFVPLTGGAEILAGSLGHCANLESLTLELNLSGRAAGQRMRGRLLAGLAAPSSIRLEALAPFGRPVFILAASPGASVLLLPRDNLVLRDALPNHILEALAGVDVGVDDLRALLAGCPTAALVAQSARRFGDRWIAIDLENGAVAYLRRDGAWRPAAVVRGHLRAVFEQWSGDHPGVVRLESASQEKAGAFDLSLRLAQVERNVPLPPEAFTVDIPADAEPITLEDLRRSGPMRDVS
jgi:outer membrane biogenesis lipoprotein LolB